MFIFFIKTSKPYMLLERRVYLLTIRKHQTSGLIPKRVSSKNLKELSRIFFDFYFSVVLLIFLMLFFSIDLE